MSSNGARTTRRMTVVPPANHEAEKLALDYWNSATQTAAKIAEVQYNECTQRGDQAGAAVAARIHRLILAEKAPFA
jgi:hypothetical protein